MGQAFTVGIDRSEPLRRLADKFEEAAEILTDIETYADDVFFPAMRDWVRRVYATQGSAIGEPWADYSDEPRYAAFKAAVLGYDGADDLPTDRNTSGGLMRWGQSGDHEEWLYPSLTDRRDPRQVAIASKSRLQALFGTTVPHAESAAEKTTEGPKGETSPPRPILRAPQRDAKRGLIVETRQHFRQRLGRAGFLE